jgi:predicted CoA-binding protein
VYRSVVDIPVDKLDRVSVYLPPERTLAALEEIARKPADEVWLNPGTESAEVLEKAQALGLPIVVACSIVDVGVDPHGL